MRHMLNWAVAREYLDRTPFRRGSENLVQRSRSQPFREVPLRERPAGPRLEVALEADGCLLVGELEGDSDRPWAMCHGLPGGTGVVPFESEIHVSQ